MACSLVALRCRTSDRTDAALRGAEALARMIGERIGSEPRMVGSIEPGRDNDWEADLRDSRGCLLEAGGQVEDALAAGDVPLLLAGDCSIGLTTLPVVAARRPDARILWLDAHGDFNTPGSSESGYLGGMSLAGPCGRFDAGLGEGTIAQDRVVLAGVHDLDADEREALERSAVTVIGSSPVETLVATKNALDRAPVFIHLDLDVIGEGGLAPDKLLDVLEAVGGDCEIVGAEITNFHAPEDELELAAEASALLHVLEPLLNAIPEETDVRD